MKLKEKLYNNIRPSLKRDEKPFIPSTTNENLRKLGDLIINYLFKRNFSSIRIKNSHYFNQRNKNLPNIIYAQHNCWWDGLLGYYLCRKVFKTDMRIMVEELHACPLLSRLGAFSIDKHCKKSILESLNFAINELDTPQKSLYLFPQGIIYPPHSRPIKFESGLAYIAEKLNGVNFIPLCCNYCFLREPSPEILVEVQRPITINDFNNKKRLLQFLEDSFQDGLDKQRDEIAQGKFENYATISKKPYDIFRTIEKYLKN